MWGIVPAAGHGTRIQPLAFSKELLPLGSRKDGEPERPRAVSEYLIERMARGGATRICVVISPGKEELLMALSSAEIEARVRDLGPWFHNLDLGGVKTAPEHFLGDYPAFKWRRFAHAIPADLRGVSVLDVGCNAGDPTNIWIPNRACAEAMLRGAGFAIESRPEPEVYICRRDANVLVDEDCIVALEGRGR